jgi:hypothetical protein
MSNKTIADRLDEAKGTGKEAKFYATDATSTGTEYEFTPSGLTTFIAANTTLLTATDASALTAVQAASLVQALPLRLPTYTVATVPSAATYARGLIYISDGTANKRLAISDGTDWRFPDGNVVT